ncbi:hypothetical protein [Streptomyces sp. S1]|uniref:hypothetical protein n=1 Tax=Streptomyces sp. S1 TaxID=718288 RepID=UPI003D74BD80
MTADDCRCAECGNCRHDHRGFRHAWQSRGPSCDDRPELGPHYHLVDLDGDTVCMPGDALLRWVLAERS